MHRKARNRQITNEEINAIGAGSRRQLIALGPPVGAMQPELTHTAHLPMITPWG